MERDRKNFLSCWTIFCPFTSLTNPENQNFEKMKKVPGHIIILHMCTINENHMMYGSWHMENNRQNFSHFGPFFAFLPPPPPNNPENQNFEKKRKKRLEISSFYRGVPKIMIISILFLRYGA